jgi:ABC-type Zn2+ transport system substrate-binding protein/surface adhesin
MRGERVSAIGALSAGAQNSRALAGARSGESALGGVRQTDDARHESEPARRSGGSQHDPDRKQKPDLVVLATRGKHGLPLWLKPSISKAIARRTKAMTLFVPRGCRGTSSTLSGSSCAG